MFPVYLRVVCAALAALSLYLCVLLGNSGFDEVMVFKQLERVVETDIVGATNGQVQLKGRVDATKTITSPSAGVPSVYFRYLLEEEKTDSEGNTTWRQVKNYHQAVDFKLVDHSGSALAMASRYTDQINWQVKESYHRTIGKFRHTEWRIEPDQLVSTFARAEVTGGPEEAPDVAIHFNQQGIAPAIMTNMGMHEVRSDMGSMANFKIWGSVSLVGLATFFILFAMKVHRILAYLSILTLSSVFLMGMSGVKMLGADVKVGSQFVESRSQALKQEVAQLAEAYGVDFENGVASAPNVPSWVFDRLSALSVNVLYLEQNFARQNQSFPENLAIDYLSIALPKSDLPLSPEAQSILDNRLASETATRLSRDAYWWLGGAALVFLLTAWMGVRSAKVKRLIENVTTSFSNGLSYGIAELKGELNFIETKSDAGENEELMLSSPLTKSPCAWYYYEVEEKRGSGEKKKWVTIQEEERFVNFACKDREGEVLIDPAEADVMTRHKKVEQRGKLRYTEQHLKLSDELYIIGQAEPHPERAELMINKGGSGDLFIISNYSESEVMLKKALSSMFVFLCSFSALFLFVITWRGTEGQFSATDYMAAGLVAPIFLGFLVLILHYNDIVFLKTRALRNWANIQVSLKKRFDLLPQLENVFSAYLKHESELQQLITEQRSLAKAALDSPGEIDHFIRNEQSLNSKARLLVEAYPELKANQLCSQLTQTITKLENEIALMRSGYNDAASHYNARIQSFPDQYLAKPFGFTDMELIVG